MLPIVIVGAGGHAKVLLDALRRQGQTLYGLCDTEPDATRARFSSEHVIGRDEDVLAQPPGRFAIAIGVGSTRSPVARMQLYERYRERGFSFATVLHPSAVVAADARIGEGAQIMAGCVIQPCARIGANAVVNTGATVDHDATIGDHTFIAPGVTLCGGVAIGAGCHIGAGATVLEYRRIGDGATVGAGAVVTRDVADGVTVTGVPARETVGRDR